MKNIYHVRNKIIELFIINEFGLCLIGLVAIAGYPIESMLLASLTALYNVITILGIHTQLKELL